MLDAMIPTRALGQQGLVVSVVKNLGEALEGLLARHLAAHRNSLAEKSLATPLADTQSKQPPKLSPKEV